MQNKYIKLLIIILAVTIIVPQITLAAWWNPVSWGLWGKIWSTVHKSVSKDTFKNDTKKLVGNDKDSHGCIGSAGYTWCEVKQKCLRVWEEKCEATPANYFGIKELGLKFKITDDIKDLTYVVKGPGIEVKSTYVLFSTKSLESLSGQYCIPSEGPLGAIVMFNALPSNSSIYSHREPILQDNNLYVYFDTPQATCSDKKSVQDLQTKQSHSLQEDIKTITKI